MYEVFDAQFCPCLLCLFAQVCRCPIFQYQDIPPSPSSLLSDASFDESINDSPHISVTAQALDGRPTEGARHVMRRGGLQGGIPSESPSVDILLYYKGTDALGIHNYLHTMTPTFAPLPPTAPVEDSIGSGGTFRWNPLP